MFRLKHYLCHDSRYLEVNSFIFSNFNYCPLIWHFSIFDSEDKLEKLYQRSLKFLNDKSDIPQTELVSMKVKRLRTLAIEIFKTLNNLNPSYMKDILKTPTFRSSNRLKFNIQTQKFNHIKYGRKSLRVLGPMLWNSLPNEVKCIETLPKFKTFIKTCGTDTCPHYKDFTPIYHQSNTLIGFYLIGLVTALITI